MSIITHHRKAAAAASLALLLVACSSAPKVTPEAQAPESNEPDLVAQLRERMASGQLQRREKADTPASVAATADTSNAPRVVIDPALQLAAQAVAPDYGRAIALVQAGNDAEALPLFRDIAARAPQLAGPRLNQAAILLRQQKHAEAEALLRDLLRSNPKSPFAHNLLGIALRQQGKFAEARAAYEAALALDPDYARAHFNLGVLLDLYQQDLPTALRHYERYQALQSKPDPAVANWIVDLQKRTGVYKPPPKPAPAPVAAPVEEGDAPAPAGSGAVPAGNAAPVAAPVAAQGSSAS